jgi:adenylosuccinate synthase
VALKYAIEVNGITGLALMKADVLQNIDSIQVCTAYRLGSTTIYHLPAAIEDLNRIEPVYEILPGWGFYPAKGIRTLSDLPLELQNFIHWIEQYLNIPIFFMSTGPGREETLMLSDPFC